MPAVEGRFQPPGLKLLLPVPSRLQKRALNSAGLEARLYGSQDGYRYRDRIQMRWPYGGSSL